MKITIDTENKKIHIDTATTNELIEVCKQYPEYTIESKKDLIGISKEYFDYIKKPPFTPSTTLYPNKPTFW